MHSVGDAAGSVGPGTRASTAGDRLALESRHEARQARPAVSAAAVNGQKWRPTLRAEVPPGLSPSSSRVTLKPGKSVIDALAEAVDVERRRSAA